MTYKYSLIKIIIKLGWLEYGTSDLFTKSTVSVLGLHRAYSILLIVRVKNRNYS